MNDDAAASSRGLSAPEADPEPDDEMDSAASPSTERSEDEHQDRADRLAERIAMPVLIAALAAVPAVFLTLFDDPYQTLGEGLNTLSGGVLIAETVVLLAVSENRWAWIKRNKWLVLLAAAIIPAIVFAVGPVQLLRLLRVAGALRIIRVKRIFKAGKIVRERAGLNKTWERVIGVGVTVLCAAFVAVMLADPTATREISRFGSESQDALGNVVNRLGWIGVAVAGLIVFGATYIVWSNRRQGGDDTEGEEATGERDGGVHGEGEPARDVHGEGEPARDVEGEGEGKGEPDRDVRTAADGHRRSEADHTSDVAGPGD